MTFSGTTKVFFSGDSGYSKIFEQIGDRYGPFDISLIHIGAYNKNWPYIHTTPEQSVQVHLDLKSNIFLPIHWGTFKQSDHGWYDPIERVLKAAQDKKVKLVIPMPGESITVDQEPTISYWWRINI